VTLRGLADNHNHFMMEGSLDRMLAAAEASPVVGEIAFTEHVFNFDEARRALPELRRFGPEGGRAIAYDDYLGMLDAVRDQAGVRVLVGVELDMLPGDEGYESRLAGFRAEREDGWDIVLGSVHVLREGSDVQGPDPRLEAEEAWDDYLEQLGQAVTSGRYDVVTHPVRLGVGVPGRPAGLDEGLRHLAGLAAEADVALEINGGDLRRRPDLVHELVDACAREHAPVSLGSDAHRPHSVGSVAGALPLLREAGITHAARFERRERTLVPLP
jgi:histidinol phosphatase-like PHP family hydrolase